MPQTIIINSKGMPSTTRLRKAESDVISLKYDFGLFFGSDTASTATVTADSGLTVGAPTVASNIVTFTLSGGDDGSTYDLTVKLQGTSETKEIITQVLVKDYDYPDTNDYHGWRHR